MPSTFYEEELQRLLDKKFGKSTRKGSTRALMKEALDGKGLALNGEYSLVDANVEDISDEMVEAVMEHLDDVIDELLDKSKVKRRTKGDVQLPVQGLRTVYGSLIGLGNLTAFLNLSLSKEIQKLMGTGGRLVNRTGRFANSASIDEIDLDNGGMSVYFSYMVEPYRIFAAVGGRYPWNIPNRDPVDLISQAIHNGLRGIVHPDSLSSLTQLMIEER